MSRFSHFFTDDANLFWQFSRLVGHTPTFFLFADSFDDSETGITTWASLKDPDDQATVLTGSLSLDDVGYNGKKAVTISSNALVLDSIVGTHQGGQERTIAIAMSLGQQSAARSLVSSALSSGSADDVAELGIDSADLCYVKKGTSITTPSTGVPEDAPVILVCRSNGSSVTITMRVQGVTSVILDTTLTETSVNHNQLTLFARRIGGTTTQQTTAKVRAVCYFDEAISVSAVDEVIRLLESPAHFGCSTIEEPEVQLSRLLGETPHVFLYGRDLVPGTSPDKYRNRGIGADIDAKPFPVGLPTVQLAYNNVPCVTLKGDGYLDASTSIDSDWGGFDDPQVVVLAFEFVNVGTPNMFVWMQRSNTVNPISPPIEVLRVSPDALVIYNEVGDSSGFELVGFNNVNVRRNANYVLAYSIDGAGNVLLGYRYRTKTGVFNEKYMSGNKVTGILKDIHSLFLGGQLSSSGHVAYDLGYFPLWTVTRGASCADLDELKAVMDLVEDPKGFNLPMGPQVNPQDGIPLPTDLTTWYIARMQYNMDPLTAVDDLSVTGRNGAPNNVDFLEATEEYDFLTSDARINAVSTVIPAGTGSFTFMAFVSVKVGQPFISTEMYYIQGPSNTGSVSILVHELKLKVQWNNTTYDTGVLASSWLPETLHIVAYTFDGTTIRVYVDDMSSTVYSVNPGVARTTNRNLVVGAWNNTSGWRNKMRAFSYYGDKALNSAQLQQLAVANGMNMAHLYVEGDQNISIDSAAPAGAGSFWNIARTVKFPAAGYATGFELNNAVSGTLWSMSTPTAPTSLLLRGEALDALAVAGRINLLLLSTGSNDVNVAGMTLSTLQANIRAYCEERLDSGKWHRILVSELPPQTLNTPVNNLITAYNTWLPTLISEGLVHGVVELPAELQDDQDTDYFFPNSSSNIPPAYNSAGNSVFAEAVIETLQLMDWA